MFLVNHEGKHGTSDNLTIEVNEHDDGFKLHIVNTRLKGEVYEGAIYITGDEAKKLIRFLEGNERNVDT